MIITKSLDWVEGGDKNCLIAKDISEVVVAETIFDSVT